MRLKTFTIACALAVAVFVFAQRPAQAPSQTVFSGVVDLTTATPRVPPRQTAAAVVSTGTHLEAPARFGGGWSVDQIPAERLLASLVVLDVRRQAAGDAQYQVSMNDVAAWEQAHGPIPSGAVVMALTGSAAERRDRNQAFGFALETARFLVQARQVTALGLDASSATPTATAQYLGEHSVYLLENAANLERVPPAGAILVVAPAKFAGADASNTRLLALVQAH